MRRTAILLSAAALVVFTANVFAQAKPNFAGKWTRDAAMAAPAGGGGGGRGGGGWGAECTITQTATDLTVEYMGGGQTPAPIKLVYKLDGSESKNQMAGRGGAAPTDVVSKVMWEGAGEKLLITTTTANGNVKRVLSLEGGKLSIETTSPGRNGGEPTTSKTTYTKGM